MLSAACGRVGFDPVAGDAEVAPGDGPSRDGGSDGAIDAQVTCPGTYLMVAGLTSRYRVFGTSVDWLTAEQRCEQDGTHLWVPDSLMEKTAVIALIPSNNLWTGVTDRVSLGQWLRVTGGLQTYLPWEPGEPDLDSLQRCVQIDSQMGLFGDHECFDPREYVCECDGAAVDPTTY